MERERAKSCMDVVANGATERNRHDQGLNNNHSTAVMSATNKKRASEAKRIDASLNTNDEIVLPREQFRDK